MGSGTLGSSSLCILRHTGVHCSLTLISQVDALQALSLVSHTHFWVKYIQEQLQTWLISGTVNEGRKQHPWMHYRHLNKPFRPTVVGNITHMHCQRTDVIQCLPFFHSANSKICFRRLKSTSVEYFSLRVTISVAKVLSGLEPSTPNISTTNFPFPGD